MRLRRNLGLRRRSISRVRGDDSFRINDLTKIIRKELMRIVEFLESRISGLFPNFLLSRKSLR